MERFKRFLRLSGLGVLMLLASIGISIGGGVPIPFSRKHENTPEPQIELFEDKREEASVEKQEEKKP